MTTNNADWRGDCVYCNNSVRVHQSDESEFFIECLNDKCMAMGPTCSSEADAITKHESLVDRPAEPQRIGNAVFDKPEQSLTARETVAAMIYCREITQSMRPAEALAFADEFLKVARGECDAAKKEGRG